MSKSKTCGYWHNNGKWRFITKTVDGSLDYETSWMPLDGKVALAFGCAKVLPDKTIRKLYRQTRKMFIEPWYKRLFRKILNVFNRQKNGIHK